MDQHQQIDEARGDIAALETEVAQLELELAEVVQDVRLAEQDVRSEELSRIYNKPDPPNEPRDDDYDVAPIQHSYFDDSIAHFFSSKEEKPKDTGAAARNQWIVDTKENILYENVYRLVGVTAFSIDQPDTLGLRFDVFSTAKKSFVAPHYVILRRITVQAKGSDHTTTHWEVYRDTLPSYVGLTSIATKLESSDSSAVDDFVHAIRDVLVQCQFKHDTFDRLFELNRSSLGFVPMEIIISIDKDLACQRVKLELHNSVNQTSDWLVLECSLDSVVSAHYESKTELSKVHRTVETILCCPIKNLETEFGRCIKLLVDNDLF